MNSLKFFLKDNKTKRENVKFAPTKSLCGESGEPVEWIIRPLTSRETEDIREECMRYAPGSKRPELNLKKFLAKRMAASVVEPDLYNAALQDSYGVKTPEELIFAMIDDPKEYYAFAAFIEEMSGGCNFREKVDEAKN